MVSLPTGRADVVIATVPPLTAPEPSDCAPLVKLMVPVTPEGTVAVMVTLSPNTLGPLVETVTVGVALLTTWFRFADAVLLFASPLYSAVMVLLPRASEEALMVATPPEIVAAPSETPPFAKVTVPVTLPGKVAVKVTGWLKSEGLEVELRAIDGVALPTA